MLKRKPLIFFTLVFAIAALFAASEVMAQSEDCTTPDSCTANGYIITALRGTNGEFPVKATCPIEDPASPGDYIDVDCWKYAYEYSGTGDIQKVDHVYFGIAYNECYDPINLYLLAGQEYYEACEGDANNKWLQYDCTARVLRVSPQQNKVVFYADTDRVGPGSHYISAGRKKYGCLTPIIVPGYNPEAPIGARTFSECANFGQETPDDTRDDVSFYMVRSSDQEGCIMELLACKGFNCATACQKVDSEALPSNYVLQASFLRACPNENMSVDRYGTSTFYLYKFYSGGVLYKMCLDLDTGAWVPISSCQ